MKKLIIKNMTGLDSRWEIHTIIDFKNKSNQKLLTKISGLLGVARCFTEDRYVINIDIGKCFEVERILDDVKKQILIYISQNKLDEC